MQVSSSVRSLTSAEARVTRVPELDRLVLPEDGSSSRRSLVTVFRVDPALPSSASSSIVRFCPPSLLPLSYSVLENRIETLLLLLLQQGNGYEQRVSRRLGRNGKGEKTGSTVAVLAWRDHVRGFKELDPSACARFTQRIRAACKRKIYGVQQPFARGLCREKGKGAKRRDVLGSKATPFHAGAIIFPAFHNR